MTIERVFVIGLGSMGKRRIRNLSRIGVKSIIGFDPRKDRRDEARAQTPQLETVADVADGFNRHPDAVVVSTPPELHVRFARAAVRQGVPVFTEASVVDDEMSLLRDEAASRRVLVAPSCTMRFWPSVKKMKELVDAGRIGRTLAYTHHSGQYLPDWHPWEDYRQFYAGKRLTGACREIVPFELIWITWIAGAVSDVSGMRAKVSELDVDIDDVYQVLLRHQSGAIGHLLVDVLAREPVRRSTLIGSEGSLHWEWSARTVTLFEAATKQRTLFTEDQGTVQPGYVHAEEPYVEEMRLYLAAASGEGQWPYSLDQDIAMLGLLQAAERSSDRRANVAVDELGRHTT